MDRNVSEAVNAFAGADGQRHTVLGFDARQNWLPMANWWPQNGPFLYLLRDDVERPASVDKNIWSSVCAALADLARPDDAGPLPPLWSDYERLRRHVDAKDGMRDRQYSLIAVTLAVDSLNPEAPEWLSLLGPDAADLGPLDQGWRLMGYDVANPKLYSALTDAPYHTEHEDVPSLQRRWAGHLNDRHLFTAFEEAQGFLAIAEQRARRLAPFGVFGLWERV
ncbi:MAG: hypothetical protein ACOYXR_07515 [Nitrospirota bacterium]